MKLNQATDYAFRMVLHMALLPSGSKITGAVLAEQELIPERFLLKIMRSLIAAGIMKSFRGVDGGFALNRSPQEISLLDVIRAVEGDAYLQRPGHPCAVPDPAEHFRVRRTARGVGVDEIHQTGMCRLQGRQAYLQGVDHPRRCRLPVAVFQVDGRDAQHLRQGQYQGRGVPGIDDPQLGCVEDRRERPDAR